jgi:mRNA interferase MazF
MAINPRRGEIWRVDLEPAIGAEIKKTRPVVVVNSDAIGVLPLRLVAPLTGWQSAFANYEWHVRIDPNSQNGLTKSSSVDTLQLRGVDTSRFINLIGTIDASDLSRIVKAIKSVIDL